MKAGVTPSNTTVTCWSWETRASHRHVRLHQQPKKYEHLEELYADPFRAFTGRQLLAIAFSRPMAFPPGTNWGYAHTNYVILGQILEKIGGKPLATLLCHKVLDPLGLTNTVASQN